MDPSSPVSSGPNEGLTEAKRPGAADTVHVPLSVQERKLKAAPENQDAAETEQ